MPWLERRTALRLGALLLLLSSATGGLVALLSLRCAPTTLFVVRHADRAGSEDGLTAAGVERASALAHALAKEPLAAVYHSDTRRTRDTAAPLAHALGLAPLERPALAVDGLVREIFAEHRGERTLVIAHSNTAAQIIAAAGGPALPGIADDEFDDLFVLDACRCLGGLVGRASLHRLQYGPPSP